MEILYPYVRFLKIIRKILRHPFGKCRYQDLIFLLRGLPYLGNKIIYLSLRGTNGNLGIKQPCRPDDLLRPQQLMLLFIL